VLGVGVFDVIIRGLDGGFLWLGEGGRFFNFLG
jgi:hypothetical protein